MPNTDVGTASHLGGISVRVVLGPGEAFTDEVDLGGWFALQEAGAYAVHGSYFLDFLDPHTGATVWEDWATADCEVRIEER